MRAEYPLAHARSSTRSRRRAPRGCLGDDVLGEGFAFDVEIRIGAGAYVCGEETALFESIEGNRGEPRNKPPFPVEVGLFGKPTVVNNVETLVNVLDIVSRGGAAYAETGTEGSTGTRLFCVSGHVERPGALRGAVRHDAARAARPRRRRRRRKARASCSAAPPALPPARTQLDLPLTFEAAREAASTLGSGVVIVSTRRVGPAARCCCASPPSSATSRAASASPAASAPCARRRRCSASSRHDRAASTELATLAELGQVMRDASICGLGQTAASAVESAIERSGSLRMSDLLPRRSG